MCMINVVKVCESKKLPKFAYKVTRGTLVGPFSCIEITRGVWQDAKSEPEHKGKLCYSPGFHVFSKKRGAEAYAQDIDESSPVFFPLSTVERVEIQGPAHQGDTPLRKGFPPLPSYSVAKIRFPIKVTK